ncbi:MAG: ERF family protein, partial [Nostoc sp.]
MQKLISALIKAKAEFQPIHKNKTNPHYKSKYADLDSVLDAV